MVDFGSIAATQPCSVPENQNGFAPAGHQYVKYTGHPSLTVRD